MTPWWLMPLWAFRYAGKPDRRCSAYWAMLSSSRVNWRSFQLRGARTLPAPIFRKLAIDWVSLADPLLPDGGQQDRHQQRNDGDDDQKFHNGEGSALFHMQTSMQEPRKRVQPHSEDLVRAVWVIRRGQQ